MRAMAQTSAADPAPNVASLISRVRFPYDLPPIIGPPEGRVSGLDHGAGLGAPPGFCNEIGTLLPIDPWGRSSL